MSKVLPTYSAQGSGISGSPGKIMLGLFNPTESGKVLKVRKTWAFAANPTADIVHWEFRRATYTSGGVLLAAILWDTTDPAAIAEARTEPVAAEGSVLYMWADYTHHPDSCCRFDEISGEVRPVYLRPGEGFVMKMLDTNETYDIGILWTEEDA